MPTISEYVAGIGILACVLLPRLGLAADIEVMLHGFTPTGGLQVALYNSEAGYQSEKRFGGVQIRAHANPLRVIFADIPPGQYAIAAFHDKNENEKLDANMLGIPTEAYGFSTNARGTFGPPGFEAISFMVESTPLTLNIELK